MNIRFLQVRKNPVSRLDAFGWKKHVCLTILMMISLISANLGAAMSKPIVTRLGDANVGDLQSDREGTRTNDPTPIILWSHNTPATVLYYSAQIDLSGKKGRYTQKIGKLNLPDAGVSEKLKSAFSSFPITFSASFETQDELRSLDDIQADAIMTADINGDGTDELIVPKKSGAIDIFTDRKHLFEHKPSEMNRELYDYLIGDIHKYWLKEGQGVLYAINRSPRDDLSHFTQKDLDQHKRSANYQLVNVDHLGARPVTLETPHHKIEEVLAVGIRNLPGSGKADELVVCAKYEDDDEIYMSRHRLDGSQIAPARKLYVEIDSDAAFVFLPHCAQMVAFDAVNHLLYFVSPDKPANWLRRLALRKILDVDVDLDLLCLRPHTTGPIALLRHKDLIYALDQESMFYVWHQGLMTPQKARKSLLKIPMESPLHDLIEVIPDQIDSSVMLTIQSRAAQIKPLDDESLIHAGKEFLNSEQFTSCQEDAALTFDDHMKGEAEIYCKEKGIECPALSSIEDVKNKLPDVYDWFLRYSRSQLLNCLRTRLWYPLENEGYSLDELDDDDDYINKAQYKSWLHNIAMGGQTVLGLMDLKGNCFSKSAVEDLSLHQQDTDLDQLKPSAFRKTAEHNHVVLPLQKSGMGQAKESFYYWIQW